VGPGALYLKYHRINWFTEYTQTANIFILFQPTQNLTRILLSSMLWNSLLGLYSPDRYANNWLRSNGLVPSVNSSAITQLYTHTPSSSIIIIIIMTVDIISRISSSYISSQTILTAYLGQCQNVYRWRRDPALLSRLRAPSKFHRIPNRTKKYQSFISHALSKYQTN